MSKRRKNQNIITGSLKWILKGKSKKQKILILLAVSITLTLSMLPEENFKIQEQDLQVHFLDVGQGDATLITNDGHSMLIDAGDNTMGTKVQLYLQKQNIKKLDYLVGTHPDADHIGGLDVVITKFDCDTIFMPEATKETQTYYDVIDAMQQKRYQYVEPDVGDHFMLGDASITVIAPNSIYEDVNNASIGILIEHGENSFLFTGDAEEEAEYDMLNAGMNLQADVYKVGHHGSSSSTSREILEAITPEYAVISCGANNDYGHPHAETLNKLRERGIRVFRTDEQGTIVAVSDGEHIVFNMPPSESWLSGR